MPCSWDETEGVPMRAADFARLAAERLAELRTQGVQLEPVVSTTRKLADHFWGSAWMRHLAQCEAGGLCLAPGRSLLRHGCVLDLRLAPGTISALVSAQELYEVQLTLAPLSPGKTEMLRTAAAGNVSSLVALLEGRANEELLHTLCDPDTGLLPAPEDWKMSCTCPDWAEPCPHEAAAIYAVGVLIDREPSLLFSLRSLDPATLLSPLSPAETTPLDPAALGKTFDIDIDV